MFKNKSILLVLVFAFSIFVGSVYSVFALETVEGNAEGEAANAEPSPEAVDGEYLGGSAYDKSAYRTYNTRGYDDFDEKVFITPIESIIGFDEGVGQTAEGNYEDIRIELAQTGYQAYCMQENVMIKPEYNSHKLIETFLVQYPEGINLNTFSKEILGTQNANYPIWRDVSDKQYLMNSLEEYFGFKDQYSGDAAKAELNTAAVNSLLSQRQSCVQAWKSLGAQRRACNNLESPDTCAFTKRKVPGSGYEIHDVMSLLSDFTGGSWAGGDAKRGEELAIKWCDVLYSEPENPEESTLTPAQQALVEPIKANIINVPTYMDRGYRYGFLVAAMETRIPKKPTDGSDEATLIFNFFTKKTEKNPFDEVLVAAFKLPDIGTNKGYGNNYGHEEWNDPLDISRLVLTNEDTHEPHVEAARKVRGGILAAAEASALQTPDSRIFCYDGAFPDGNGTNSCQYPLPKALTDFINGSAVKCETKIEPVNQITDRAGLGDPFDTYGKLFTLDNGGQVLLNLFLGSPYNSDGTTPDYAAITPGKPAIESIWTIREPKPWPPRESNSYVHFYLVYPVGYELSTIEESIKGVFFNQAQIAAMNEDSSIQNNFEMTGQVMALDGGKVAWKFEDKEKTAAWECGPLLLFGIPTGLPKPCIERPSIVIKQDSGKVDILGGRLSWWLRKVQVALSARSSFAHSYFESCKTMEEFLLGKCAGAAAGGGNNTGGGSNLDDICGVAKAYNIDCDFFKAVYAIESCSGNYLPTQQYGSYNCCNSIGFCGPMAAPGGTVDIISAGDKLNICMEEDEGMDNFELAARWMLIKKWCNFNSTTCLGSPNPYEWKESYIESEGNSNINTKEEVEDFVLGWYGSINQPEPRWGGKTYVDAVLEFLATGSLWGQCAYDS